MSGNNKSQRRTIKSAQAKMRELNIRMDGNLATPVPTGFDGKQISEIIDNGAGDYTIVLLKPFEQDNVNDPVALITPLETDRVAHQYAADYDRVSVRVTDLAGAAADSALAICIKGCDNRFNY